MHQRKIRVLRSAFGTHKTVSVSGGSASAAILLQPHQRSCPAPAMLSAWLQGNRWGPGACCTFGTHSVSSQGPAPHRGELKERLPQHRGARRLGVAGEGLAELRQRQPQQLQRLLEAMQEVCSVQRQELVL